MAMDISLFSIIQKKHEKRLNQSPTLLSIKVFGTSDNGVRSAFLCSFFGFGAENGAELSSNF